MGGVDHDGADGDGDDMNDDCSDHENDINHDDPQVGAGSGGGDVELQPGAD